MFKPRFRYTNKIVSLPKVDDLVGELVDDSMDWKKSEKDN